MQFFFFKGYRQQYFCYSVLSINFCVANFVSRSVKKYTYIFSYNIKNETGCNFFSRLQRTIFLLFCSVDKLLYNFCINFCIILFLDLQKKKANNATNKRKPLPSTAGGKCDVLIYIHIYIYIYMY